MSNKAMGVLAYFIFFLPLLVDDKNEFGRFHANQGLLVLLLGFVVGILGSIPVIGWFVILPLGCILCLVLGIMGIINAANEQMKELPIIGSIRLIK